MGRPLVAAADGPPGTGITDAISAGSDESRVGRDSGQRIGNIFGRAQRLCQGGPKTRGRQSHSKVAFTQDKAWMGAGVSFLEGEGAHQR